MKITFDEINHEKKWIHSELLNSLTHEVIEAAQDDQYYDVKLLVNGIELEPVFFNSLMSGISKYIEAEVENMVSDKLTVLKNKMARLDEILSAATGNIVEEFNLIEYKNTSDAE